LYTVVARFHHGSRDLDEIERKLEAAGATSAAITRFTVVMTFDEEESRDATKRARKILDRVGATRIKITKRGPSLPPPTQAPQRTEPT
jgi:hypothetical protein